MPIKFIPFIYTGIFAAILVATVPRMEIRRLSIYGIIFGGVFDILLVTIANLTGSFGYVNYEPFGLMGIHFFAPISWSIYFIIYFYFLPKRKPYIFVYVTMGIIYSMLFCQMIAKLGVLYLSHGIVDSIVPFLIWFPTATWGYYRLIRKDYKIGDCNEIKQNNWHPKRLKLSLQPAKKIKKRADR